MRKSNTSTGPAGVPGRKIKTAILVDFMGGGGQTAEEEVAELQNRYSIAAAPDELDVYTPMMVDNLEPGTELVIYDFGGLMPGSSLMEDNARGIIKWAEDHPSALVIVVSGFTYNNQIEIEMQQQGLDSLANIINGSTFDEEMMQNPIPEWWLGHPCGQDDLPVGKLQAPRPPRFNK